jgi:hypothetical protein
MPLEKRRLDLQKAPFRADNSQTIDEAFHYHQHPNSLYPFLVPWSSLSNENKEKLTKVNKRHVPVKNQENEGITIKKDVHFDRESRKK